MLGFVAEEQNHAELVRAQIVTDPPSQAESLDAFLFGVEAVLQGLAALSSQRQTPQRYERLTRRRGTSRPARTMTCYGEPP